MLDEPDELDESFAGLDPAESPVLAVLLAAVSELLVVDFFDRLSVL